MEKPYGCGWKAAAQWQHGPRLDAHSHTRTPSPNYPPPHRFIGEWYEKEPPHEAPTEEQIAEAAQSCFIVGAIYIGWVVLAMGCVCFQGARSKVR